MPGIRWAALGIGLVVAAVRELLVGPVLLWAGVLVAHALWRVVRPFPHVTAGGTSPGSRAGRRARWPESFGVFPELAVASLAVVGTGYWDSPFVFCLMTPVVAAGFLRGYVFAALTAAGSVLAVTLPYVASTAGTRRVSVEVIGQWAVEMLLVAVLAAYARHLFGQVQERHSEAIDRVTQLGQANELLVSLHRVAQSLPASLNLDEVVMSTVGRLRSLIDCDVTAVLLRDESASRWTVAVSEGARLHGSLHQDELPAPLRGAAASSVSSLVVCLAPGEGLGLGLLSRSGLYAPLRARDTLVGLVALEHHEEGRYGRRELRLLDGFIESAALAIDNARWFTRIRSMGADQERTRIARDMHDRVGQSLAYLAFKLDRVSRSAAGHPVAPELEELRHEVRSVLTEVRDTLCDLRTDVSDHSGLVDTLDTFLERVRARAGLEVSFEHQGDERLPLVQERELWRIAHEAVVNVERHARARRLAVEWRQEGGRAHLTVTDDGRGFSVDQAGRMDSYGITGMRERAAAIGARLDIRSGPAQGTTVHCSLEPA